MKRDPDKQREWRRRGVKNYRQNLRERLNQGEGPKGLSPSGRSKMKSRPQPTTGFRLWVRETRRCCIPVCRRMRPDPHHHLTRGMGRSRDPWAEDVEAVVDLCRTHHQEVHQEGPSAVQERHNVDFDKRRVELWGEWMALPQEERERWETRAYRKNKKRGAKPARRPR